MGPDFRQLMKKARKLAVEYELMYGEEIPTVQLVAKVAAFMQEYSQSGLVGLCRESLIKGCKHFC